MGIVGAIRGYYNSGGPAKGISFLIQDSERGGLGSGIVQALTRTSQYEADDVGTATA